MFEGDEVKSALAHSLNATEIFWSDWLQFIQHFELFTDGPTVNIVLVYFSVKHTTDFLVSNFHLLHLLRRSVMIRERETIYHPSVL